MMVGLRFFETYLNLRPRGKKSEPPKKDTVTHHEEDEKEGGGHWGGKGRISLASLKRKILNEIRQTDMPRCADVRQLRGGNRQSRIIASQKDPTRGH